MTRLSYLLAAGAALAALSAAAPSLAQPASVKPAVDMSYQRFTLPNGLTVLVHEDRKAPVVAVSIIYRVGSEDERPGRTGFAHMFEHLMFKGSAHAAKTFDKILQDVGATQANASTWWDYTEFHETVPTSALDYTLFYESDRMGYLPAALTQEAVDTERGVVKNELRQKENAPAGRAEPYILKGIFPAGHPYGWTPLGSIEDLDAATLDEIRAWHAEHYGPNNAVLSLSGDIDLATAKRLVERYFGDLKPTPLRTELQAFAVPMTAPKREVMVDNAAAPRIFRAWPGPGAVSPDSARLDLLIDVIGDGQAGVLNQRLVKQQKVASSLYVMRPKGRASSMILLIMDVAPGVKAEDASAALDAALADLRTAGPAPADVAAGQARLSMKRTLELETAADKAYNLGLGEVHEGDPARDARRLAEIAVAKPAALRDLAAAWLSKNDYQLDVLPSGQLAAGPALDRSKPPVPGPAPAPRFPPIERATLSNGLKLVVVPRPNEALTRIALQFDAGMGADAPGRAGIAGLAADMLDEGSAGRPAETVARDVAGLGGQFEARSTFDSTTLVMTVRNSDAPAAAGLMAEMAAQPDFPADSLARVKAERTARIAQEIARPDRASLRYIPPALYGATPYGAPFSGLGSAAVVAAAAQADMRAFQSAWLRPDNATLYVVGDVTVDQARRTAEQAFARWRAPAGAKGAKPAATTAPPATRLLLLDRPNSPQTVIVAAQLLPADADPTSLTALNAVFGGTGWGRANTDLRTQKGWAYYAMSRLSETRGPDAFVLTAPVQADKSIESIREVRALLDAYGAAQPITAEELAKAVSTESLAQAGRYESSANLLDALLTNTELGRPDDYLPRAAERLKGLTLPQVQALGLKSFGGARRVWFIAGDMTKLRSEIDKLNLGPATVIDPTAEK